MKDTNLNLNNYTVRIENKNSRDFVRPNFRDVELKKTRNENNWLHVTNKSNKKEKLDQIAMIVRGTKQTISQDAINRIVNVLIEYK